MEGFVAQKLNEFENGKISRRRLIEQLTLAATTLYAAGSANAQADTTLKAQLINHISYTCPEFKAAADWYAKVFNLDQVGQSKNDIVLPFGKKGEQPYNVTAKDVPLSHLIIRTPDRGQGGPPRATKPTAQAVIDYISYTVADFNRDRARSDLTALGVKNVRDGGPRSLRMDDVYGYEIEICGIESSALTEG